MKETPDLSGKSIMVEGLVECLIKAISERYKVPEVSFYQGPKVSNNAFVPVISYHEIIYQYFIKFPNLFSHCTYFGLYRQLQTIYPIEMIHEAILKCLIIRDIKYFIKTFDHRKSEMRIIEYFPLLKNQNDFKTFSDISPAVSNPSIDCFNKIVGSDVSFLEGIDSDVISSEDQIFIDCRNNKEFNSISFKDYNESKKCKVKIDNSFLENLSPIVSKLNRTGIKRQKIVAKFSYDHILTCDLNCLEPEIYSEPINCKIPSQKGYKTADCEKPFDRKENILFLANEAISFKINENFNPLCCLISEKQMIFSGLGKKAIEIMREKSKTYSKKLFLNKCKKSFFFSGINFLDVLKMINILEKEKRVKNISNNPRATRLDMTDFDKY